MNKKLRTILARLVLAAFMLPGLVLLSGQLVGAYNTYASTLFPGDIAVNGDIKVIGNDLLDSGETTRLTLGSTNAITGNLTVSGTLATTGAQTQTGALSVTGATTVSTITVNGIQGLILGNTLTLNVTTPTVVNTLAVTSAGVLYISTGTSNAFQWSKVGAQ